MIKIYKIEKNLTEKEKRNICGKPLLKMIEIKTSPTEYAKQLIYNAIEDIEYKIYDNEELTEREQKLVRKQVERLTKQLMKKL